MSCSTYASAPVLTGVDDASAKRATRKQRVLGFLLVLAVIAVDQGTKAWAWRHIPGTSVNSGSTCGKGGPLKLWLSGPVSGAFLDVLDFSVLCLGGLALLRRSRPPAILVSASLMIAGWGSNLLDRLGMHTVTAPGSVRGAVDFIRMGHYRYNLADVVIVAATIAFLALVARRVTSGVANSSAIERHLRRAEYRRLRTSRRPRVRSAWICLTVAMALCVDVSLGAAHYGGVHYSSTSTSSCTSCRTAVHH